MKEETMTARPINTSLLIDLIRCCGRQTVTAAVPQAASAGLEMLARGGNAFDAALAACFVETVALPMKCGLAGDLVTLFSVKGGPVQAIVSIGQAPGKLMTEGVQLSSLGPCSVGVPGAPDGYAQLHTLAKLPLDELVRPAISAAQRGIPWTRIGLGYLLEARQLLEQWSPDCLYLRNGLPQPGDLLRLPGMAALLNEYANTGAALFDGQIGHQLSEHVSHLGGFITHGDLQTRPARWCQPVSWQDGLGHTVYATPDPTHGELLIEALAEGRASGQARATASAQVGIIERVRKRAKARGRDIADEGTSVVTAADIEGNTVVVVHSNSYPRFGSGVVLDNGLVLNNRPGRGFDLDAPPGARNAPAPGVVPPTTLHAWALQDSLSITFGATPGGVNQLPWNYQMLDRLLAGEPFDQALLEPRWAVNAAGSYCAEAGLSLEIPGGADVVDYLALRSAHQAVRRRNDGWLEAFADPRVGAKAIATL